MLGLAGEVGDDQFLSPMAGMDPQRPDPHLGRAYDDKSVRGFDVTCSEPKSASVMFALGGDDVRRQVLASHDAAVAALAGWIERHAHTRFRIGGEVAVVDAEGIVAAAFRQHTSGARRAADQARPTDSLGALPRRPGAAGARSMSVAQVCVSCPDPTRPIRDRTKQDACVSK
jgi:conjugative relaxase-like TrwC/TraI family protein